MRSYDWSSTSLGPVESWPQSLRSAVSILLPSKAQIVLFWGADLVALYNDAYAPVFGAKHPWALGKPARESWSEVWHVLGPLFEGVIQTGEAFHAQDHRFLLNRQGFLEENYFDVSYDPVRVEDGSVGGLFCIVSDTTGRVQSERRLRTLRELDTRTSNVATSDDIWRAASDVLGTNVEDVPFALLYRVTHPSDDASLVAVSGLPAGAVAQPMVSAAIGDGSVVAASTLVSQLPETAAAEALVLPITAGTRVVGFMVAGVSRDLQLVGGYRSFFDLVAGRLSSAMTVVRALDEERRRAEALTALDRAKTAFFSNVSHEFRTPLTLLLAPLEDALAVAGDEAVRAQLDMAYRNALRLLKLVNTLLDFSRIEAGRAEAVFEPVDLATHTAELASVFRSTVERAGLAFHVECTPLPEPVMVDREMWEKVVFNLVSNALKFTFHGKISVEIRAQAGHAIFEVADTGVGIAPEDQLRVFERFYRVRDVRSRTHEGTGIGLALVQELVRLHGGALTLESVPGEGSRFRVTVPFGVAHLPPERLGANRRLASTALSGAAYVEEARRWLGDDVAPDAEQPIAVGAGSARVLLVDDNADMREYLDRVLREYWTIETAADGAEALAAIRERPPDLVLSDVMMPGLDGFQLLHALRTDERTRAIPVILLSARAGEESRVEGLDAGANDYLVKPFSARELVARVNAHLEIARVRREADASLAALLERERAARAEAEAANRSKDEFLAVLSHELRTPLNAVVGWTRILMTTPPQPATTRRALETIERNAQMQAQLIDDLLDVSRIIAGKLALESMPVDPVQVATDAMQSVSAMADAKRVRLTRVVSGSTVGRILGDPRRLQQVVWNLLTNAIKFSSPEGEVRLTLRRVGDWAEILVEDNGTGIERSFLPHVFERFRQNDSTTTREQSGLGLGLAIVRHIVERHGGTITAESEGRGRGATFHVRLPRLTEMVAERAGAGDRSSPEEVSTTLLSGVRVLVVEDERDSREMICRALEVCGATVVAAPSVAEALSIFDRERPHVVVSDLSMPGRDGFDLIREVRARRVAGQASVAVVALTAYARPEDRTRSLEAGFDMHVSKPVDPVDLAIVVARLAAGSR